MSYKLCTVCNHSGVVHQMKEDYLQTWIPGTQVEVIKYTCPYCGKVEGRINTHGVAITPAEKTDLCANVLGLAENLVEIGSTMVPSSSTFGALGGVK